MYMVKKLTSGKIKTYQHTWTNLVMKRFFYIIKK